MTFGLKGKRAIVLAASRGLGYACAMELARQGCDVVICSRNRERIDEAAAKIRDATGARVHPVAADVSTAEAFPLIADSCVKEFGGIEIAVHNAGGPPAGSIPTLTDEQWASAFNANLMSFVRLTGAVTGEMKKAGYGRLIAMTSSSIRQPIPNLMLSNAMRTGVLGIAKTLSRELAPDGILVNVVAPGRIATERLDELDQANATRTGQTPEEVRRQSIDSIPLGRLGRPEEFANLVVFLSSEAASYITGSAIMVDGGMVSAL